MLGELRQVQIQTVDACTRGCSFCPRSYIKGTRKQMKVEDYKQIINELKENDYLGQVTPYLKNEPLLDDRLVSLVEYTREQLPYNDILISTNGDLLTRGLKDELIEAGVTTFKVSVYDWRTAMKVRGWSGIQILPFWHKGTDSFNNRGGNIDVGDDCNSDEPCLRPFHQLYIDYDGKAVLCCADYKREVIMGDVIKDGLFNVWANDKYQHYRQELIKGNRAALKLCRKCNYSGSY